MFQFTRLFPDHATQENLSAADAAALCEKLLREDGYAQAVFFSRDADWHITCYGRLKIRKQPPTTPTRRRLRRTTAKSRR